MPMSERSRPAKVHQACSVPPVLCCKGTWRHAPNLPEPVSSGVPRWTNPAVDQPVTPDEQHLASQTVLFGQFPDIQGVVAGWDPGYKGVRIPLPSNDSSRGSVLEKFMTKVHREQDGEH